ncbi:MAG: chaperonin GroEL, partial [Gammaproteobacteria bacterium]|nr:chaperonin GroEL [Gammaproteobacteria bacterium]
AILENADTSLMEPLMNQVLQTKGQGVDVVTGAVVDMVKRGIIDPVLVTKTALKNAVSVTSTIISADAILSNKRIN